MFNWKYIEVSGSLMVFASKNQEKKNTHTHIEAKYMSENPWNMPYSINAAIKLRSIFQQFSET